MWERTSHNVTAPVPGLEFGRSRGPTRALVVSTVGAPARARHPLALRNQCTSLNQKILVSACHRVVGTDADGWATATHPAVTP